MALKGKQTKLDANKNGRIDKDDFSILKGKKAGSKAKGIPTGGSLPLGKGSSIQAEILASLVIQ